MILQGRVKSPSPTLAVQSNRVFLTASVTKTLNSLSLVAVGFWPKSGEFGGGIGGFLPFLDEIVGKTMEKSEKSGGFAIVRACRVC